MTFKEDFKPSRVYNKLVIDAINKDIANDRSIESNKDGSEDNDDKSDRDSNSDSDN